MLINYAGKVDLSTVDWYGHGAYVIFLNGCPLKCPNCHNAQLRDRENWMSFEEITKGILGALPFVDHLVISGGEPFAQPDACRRLIKFGHDHGMMVAVETSGCLPLVDGFDMIFLSVSCSLERSLYDSYTGFPGGNANLVHNLAKLDSRSSEIRLILFKDSNYDLQSLKVLKGLPIRIMVGVRVGVGVDISDVISFSLRLAEVLDYEIKNTSSSYVLIGDRDDN